MIMKEENEKRITKMAEQRIAFTTEHRKENHELAESFETEIFEKTRQIDEWASAFIKVEQELATWKEWYPEEEGQEEAATGAAASGYNLQGEL